MTNTKFRKRALLSSVAMLLVALVALGSATFAWFTQSTSATADGIYAKTVKASNLQISKANHTWGSSVTYTQGNSTTAQIMYPASSGNGTTWFKANSDNAATGAVLNSSIQTTTTAGTNAKYVYAEELNVKNVGIDPTAATAEGPDINGITITWTWPDDTSDYIRVALVECDATGTITGTFTDSVYAKNNTQYGGLVATAGTTAQITPKTTLSVGVGNLSAGEAKYYKLFVWFEGQDANCKDTNVGQTLDGLSFTVSGTPAD